MMSLIQTKNNLTIIKRLTGREVLHSASLCAPTDLLSPVNSHHLTIHQNTVAQHLKGTWLTMVFVCALHEQLIHDNLTRERESYGENAGVGEQNADRWAAQESHFGCMSVKHTGGRFSMREREVGAELCQVIISEQYVIPHLLSQGSDHIKQYERPTNSVCVFIA